MRCAVCGIDNREGRKFCSECGGSLSAPCPACGTPNEPVDKFCGDCGAALAAGPPEAPSSPLLSPSGPAPEKAEQRFVSVLFADLVGYTTLSESRDSEDVRDLLTVYFDRARAIIEQFGGSVDKFIGDAVMGVWGAVGAREDDAQRAVRAALELVDMVSSLGEESGIPGLRLRAGVNSGQTSVGPGGNEKGLVVGDLVNVASRLEALAAPGTVNVGSATEAVSRTAIDYEYLGEEELKGKSEKVPVWRAVRVAAMREGRADDVRNPPFVGRERELRMMKDALAGVETDQRSRLLSIIGEAGIGKTRLAEEFRNHIDGYAQTIYWHWGRSPSYGDGVTFWALGEMVRRRAGIVDGEDPARSRTRLRTMITEFVPSEDDRQWIEPRLAGLLGLAEMPPGSRTELFAALRSFFQNIAAKGATILVFEDMHWADSGLIEFVGELVERSTRSPILVVTLARPDLLSRYPTWGTQHRSSMAVRLGPLNDAEMEEMLHQYIPGVGDEVVGQIAGRSTGFPLYAVEIVRMLSAAGELQAVGNEYRYEGDPSGMALPDTLQTVIGARLDRLDADLRSLLQDGAVLGQFFTLDGLARLRDEPEAQLEAALAPLIQGELLELEDDPRSPERGQYRFVQSLIHEVAYQRLSRSDRRAKHLAVAAYFGERDDPELAGLVAGHYMGAYEATPAGAEKDEMVVRAIEALTGAADRAIAFHSYQQAIELLEEAITLAPSEDRCLEQRFKVARVYSDHNDPDRGLAHLAEAGRYFEETQQVEGIQRAATVAAYILNSHFQSDRALEAIRAAYEALDEVESPVEVQLAAEACRSFALTLNCDEAVIAADRLMPAAAAMGDAETILHVLVSKATALAWIGRRVEAYTLLRGAAEEAELRGLLDPAGRALNNLSSVMNYRSPQEGARIADRLGAVISRAQTLSGLVRHASDTADVEIDDGQYDRALARLDEFSADDLSPFWQQAFEMGRARALFRRTGDPDALDRAWVAASFFDDETDLQLRAGFDIYKAAMRRDNGDWEGCYRLAVGVDPTIVPFSLLYAANAAAWLGDAARIEEVEVIARQCSDPGPGVEDFVGAIRLALQGAKEQAAAIFVDVLDLWSPRLMGCDLAQARATFVKMVGSENPSAAQAAADVEDWLSSTGTRALREVWVSVLDGTPSRETAAAG